MSCRRIKDLDLPGFLEAPSDDAFRSFREHYPGCPECSAEVRVWTELHLELTEDAARHPSPEDLLRLQDEPASLSAEERARLAGHLNSCANCREEVRSMESLAPAYDRVAAARPMVDDETPAHDDPLARPESVAPLQMSSAGRSFAPSRRARASADLESRLRAEMTEELDAEPEVAAAAASNMARVHRGLGRLGRVLWSPAFAYAALIAITLPLVYLRRDVVVEPVGQSMAPPVVVQDQMQPPAAPAAAKAPVAMRGLAAQRAEREVRPEALSSDRRFAAGERVDLKRRAEGAARIQDARPELPANARVLDYAGEPMAELAEVSPGLAVNQRGDDLLVTVPIPASARDSSSLTIEVTTADGRELRQPVRTVAGSHTVEVTLPAAWLGTDTHELRVLDGASVAARFALPTSPAND